MDFDDLRNRIETARDKVIKARNELFEDKDKAIEAKEDLNSAIAVLYAENRVSGKNDKERDASVRIQTVGVREALSEADFDERLAVMRLELAIDERRMWESMLRIEELEAA